MPVYKSKTKTKDGRQWYYSISTTVNGVTKKVNSPKYATKREAEQAESLYLVTIGRKPINKITFREVAETMLSQKQETQKPTGFAKTKLRINHILSVIGDVEVVNMTIQDYQNLRTYLDNKGFSVNYKNVILSYLKSLCKFAELYYEVSTNIPYKFANYTDKSTIKEEMQIYTLQEFNKFVSVIDDPKYIALFTVLFYCGLRRGEANALKWTDIDFANKRITISKSVTTKMRDNNGNYLTTTPKTKSSNRTLPLADAPYKALKQLLQYYQLYEGFNVNWLVFGGLNSIPETTIQNAKNRYAKLAGVKNIRLHDFRHSCASLLINHGANITLVSKYLGHSKVSMTLNIYAHFYKSDMDELIKSLNEVRMKYE